MKKLVTICAVVMVVLAVSGVANAALFSYDVAPSDLGNRDSWYTGTLFGYDHPDSLLVDYKPVGSYAVGGATGYGNSSFFSDVKGSANSGGRDYCSLRISPQDVFGYTGEVTIADLTSIAYSTKWISGVNWQIKVYTAPLAGQTTGWYGHRFNFNPAATNTGWTESSTDTLQVYNIKTGQGGAEISPNLTLSALQSNGTYNSENIMFIDIICGFMTASPAGYTYLDGVELTMANGDIANVNLIPEPATMALLGLGGLLLRRKK